MVLNSLKDDGMEHLQVSLHALLKELPHGLVKGVRENVQVKC